jgi:hypothetical protein
MYLKQVDGFYLFSWSVSVAIERQILIQHCCFKTIVKGYTKISSKAKNVTLKAAPSNVRSVTFDIFLDIFSFPRKHVPLSENVSSINT